MDQVKELEQVKDLGAQELEEDWQLDVKTCRIDGHSMLDGELCEACQ